MNNTFANHDSIQCGPPAAVLAEALTTQAAQLISQLVGSGDSILLVGDKNGFYGSVLQNFCRRCDCVESFGQAPIQSIASLSSRVNGSAAGSQRLPLRKYDVIVWTEHTARQVLSGDVAPSAVGEMLTEWGTLAVVSRVPGAGAGRPLANSTPVSAQDLLRGELESVGFQTLKVQELTLAMQSVTSPDGSFGAFSEGESDSDMQSHTLASLLVATVAPDSKRRYDAIRHATVRLDQAVLKLDRDAAKLGECVELLREGQLMNQTRVGAALEKVAQLSDQLTRVEGFLGRLDGHPALESPEGLTAAQQTIEAASTQLRSCLASGSAEYEQVLSRVRGVVAGATPPDALLLVVSRGDERLLQLKARRTRHFPSTEEGVYLGHHPADSREAIDYLMREVSAGAAYLVVPETSRWWLDYYEDFRKHLDTQFRRIVDREGACVVYDLSDGESRYE